MGLYQDHTFNSEQYVSCLKFIPTFCQTTDKRYSKAQYDIPYVSQSQLSFASNDPIKWPELMTYSISEIETQTQTHSIGIIQISNNKQYVW